jgi:phage FluMu gp28-like protein
MIDELDEVDWTEGTNLMEWLQENHPEYDGMYLDEGGTGGYSPDNEYIDRGKSIVNFRGDQVKILN